MSLKQSVQSALNRDSVLYRILASVYRHRSPHSVKRAVTMRLQKDSRFDATELWMASFCPTRILDTLLAEWNPKSFLDIGCGTGLAMYYLSQKGIECVGLEGSTAAIESSPLKQQIHCVNLNRAVKLSRTFDLVWSYEVAEHIHPRFVENFLDTLTGHGKLLAMSAAPPGQGGRGHFNEQRPEYWINKLSSRNFVFQKSFTEYLRGLEESFSANMLVFRGDSSKAA